MAIVPPVGAERPRVQLLDPHTINQIAAGEVVERPASVVKELVENALDAGAKRIEVDLEDAGRALISVRDDGSGMSPEDAQAALLRHATSKIRSADDLAEVGTLGFRGEALPSIASVSVMRLRSAVRDGEGVEIEVEGGRARPARPVALARGTEVRVENLFFNTPARLKFLKSPATELGAAMEVVSKFALAYPDVSFTLRHNGHEAIRTSGNGDLLSALADVWGRDLARGLAEVDAQVGGIHVHGFISPPHLTRPTRTYQYLFVNGRPVRTRTLTAALDQAYREITPERRFPVLVLHLDLDPARVDVNVSPTKSEVKFDREGAAFDALRIAIKSALMEHGMIPDAAGVAAANEALQATELRTPWLPRPDGGLLSQVAQAPLGEPSAEAEPASLSVPTAVSDALAETASMPSLGPSRSDRMPFAHLAEGLKVIGQAMNTFIVAETRHGIVVVDQHVAHERVLYEYLCGQKGSNLLERQPLLVPETLNLDRRTAVLLREKLDELERIGFHLEPFGADSYLVRAVPAALRGKSPLKMLRDLAEELAEQSVARRLVPTREQLWITASCKMAVKAGDPLSHAEMDKLIRDLAETENPYLCPHGRPITLTLSLDDLLRKFKRA